MSVDNYPDTEEDKVWRTIKPDDIWFMDKLILSRKLGYKCGPTGLDVDEPGYYCVRPCVNMLGLGLSTQKVWLDKSTMHLPVGHFWCEWFEGDHLSVDYRFGKQELTVQGFRGLQTFTRWDAWVKVDAEVPLPTILYNQTWREYINCEFIGNKLIEVHFRRNEDFDGVKERFIPVWEGQDTTPPEGYTYRSYPDVHGRIGAFIK